MSRKQEIINEMKGGYSISDYRIKKSIKEKTIVNLINSCPELPYHLKCKYEITGEEQINEIFYPTGDENKPNFEVGDDAFP